MVKTIMRKGGKRMKMTTKAMVRINARLLQCFNFSVTKKNYQDSSKNDEGGNVSAGVKLGKHQPFTMSYLGATIT